MDHGSRNRLTPRSLPLFPGDGLRDRLARAVCRAGCLPRKELFEAWEVARRVRRHLRGRRVVDLAAGHGLLAYAMLLLDDSSPGAVCVDVRRPPSASRLAEVIEAEWPRLAGRVRWVEGPLEELALGSDDLVVSVHACGSLSDVVLARAVAAHAPVALLPCCHPAPPTQLAGLDGWMPADLVVDVGRTLALRRAGYEVRVQRIPREVTPKNRLIVGEPHRMDGAALERAGWEK